MSRPVSYFFTRRILSNLPSHILSQLEVCNTHISLSSWVVTIYTSVRNLKPFVTAKIYEPLLLKINS